jgi:hypothetical protein
MMDDAKLYWREHTRKCIGSREEDRPCRYTISWCCTNKYQSLCGPTAYSCGHARNRATMTSFNGFKTRYLGHCWCTLVYADLHSDFQIEMVMNEIEKFAKKREERLFHYVNVEVIQLLDNSELLRRIKIKKKTFWPGVVIIKSRAQWSGSYTLLVCDKNRAQC